MGDVRDIDEARRARREAEEAATFEGFSDAHNELVDALAERLRVCPCAIGSVVITLGAGGFSWSTRYKDGVQRRQILEALDAVRHKVESDPELRDEP